MFQFPVSKFWPDTWLPAAAQDFTITEHHKQYTPTFERVREIVLDEVIRVNLKTAYNR